MLRCPHLRDDQDCLQIDRLLVVGLDELFEPSAQ